MTEARHEFVVYGTPTSLQGNKKSWQKRVTDTAEAAVPEGERFEYCDIFVWIIYFHANEMRGDLDNIAKPILDAMNSKVYFDDNQVAKLVLRRFRTDGDGIKRLEDPPRCVRDALDRTLAEGGDFVYIRVEPATEGGQLL